MLRKGLPWLGYILGAILGLVLMAVVLIYYITELRLNEVYDIPAETVTVPAQVEAEALGWQMMIIGLCQECHGPGLAGMILDDEPLTGRLVASNLTSGAGGIGSRYSDADWVRAIRHGVGPDGKTLIVMPSNYFTNLSEADLGQLIAYVKNLPPSDNVLPETALGPRGRLFLLQDPSLLPAAVIDHNKPLPPEPEVGVTVERGRYLAFLCTICHGDDLAGGSTESAGLNLTPGGDLAHWTEAEFIKTLRSGITPEGKALDTEEMPVALFDHLTDDELRAIWLYLQSLPPVQPLTASAQ